ncbi:MAG TPA: acyltransferase [Usitatibacter sp.]|nr:acyltransferase [Usitatibacter sp.]
MSPTALAARYQLLDGLRGILALAVVVHHFTATSGRREVFASSALAVDFFFCLSGFVIAHAYEAQLRAGMPIAAFMARRVRRLYPLYMVGLVLGAMAVWRMHAFSLAHVPSDVAAVAWLLNAMYLPFPNSVELPVHGAIVVAALFPFNNPAWSLFFEMAANLVYACIVRISNPMLLAVVALSAAGMVIAQDAYGEAPGWSTRNFPGGICRTAYAFFSGVLLHRWLAPGARWGRQAAIALAIAVTAMLAVPRGHGYYIEYWLACAVLVVPVVVGLAAKCDVGSGRLAAWCDYSGRLSYPLYCLHYPLLMVVGTVAETPPEYVVRLVAFVAAVIAFSHVLLVYFDEPLRARLALRRQRA